MVSKLHPQCKKLRVVLPQKSTSMKTIKILKHISGAPFYRAECPGDVVELQEEQAELLVEAGMAEYEGKEATKPATKTTDKKKTK